MEDINLFPCYSPKLMKYLVEKKQIRYKLVGLSPKSHKTFWIFIEDEKLQKALKEWQTIPQQL